ncbi:lipoprotein [Spiroplasma melliferum]|nr:lipoprotein [Spiroplasma melliferum]
MKRLFSILGAIGIFSTSAASLTACKKPEQTQNTAKDEKEDKTNTNDKN